MASRSSSASLKTEPPMLGVNIFTHGRGAGKVKLGGRKGKERRGPGVWVVDLGLGKPLIIVSLFDWPIAGHQAVLVKQTELSLTHPVPGHPLSHIQGWGGKKKAGKWASLSRGPPFLIWVSGWTQGPGKHIFLGKCSGGNQVPSIFPSSVWADAVNESLQRSWGLTILPPAQPPPKPSQLKHICDFQACKMHFRDKGDAECKQKHPLQRIVLLWQICSFPLMQICRNKSVFFPSVFSFLFLPVAENNPIQFQVNLDTGVGTYSGSLTLKFPNLSRGLSFSSFKACYFWEAMAFKASPMSPHPAGLSAFFIFSGLGRVGAGKKVVGRERMVASRGDWLSKYSLHLKLHKDHCFWI